MRAVTARISTTKEQVRFAGGYRFYQKWPSNSNSRRSARPDARGVQDAAAADLFGRRKQPFDRLRPIAFDGVPIIVDTTVIKIVGWTN
jgi:hypothetical protein